jgi:hypothetical protein
LNIYQNEPAEPAIRAGVLIAYTSYRRGNSLPLARPTGKHRFEALEAGIDFREPLCRSDDVRHLWFFRGAAPDEVPLEICQFGR